MNYNASVSDFFKSPKWGMNLLLGSVSMLIPMVGPLVLSGWHITGMWGRGDADDAEGFPPFDFQYFVKYLERGVWPFVVNLVVSLVLVPLMMLLIFPVILFAGVMDPHHHTHTSGGVIVALIAGIFVLQALLMLVFYFITTPLVLRATITQDFARAFDFGFVRGFLSRVWQELVGAMIFMFGLGLCLMVIAVVTCYLGFFFAAPVAMFSWHHLQKQLYQLYLSRGGAAVPPSPKLSDLPPALPPSTPPVLPTA